MQRANKQAQVKRVYRSGICRFSYGAVKALRDIDMTMAEGKVTCVMAATASARPRS